MDELDEDELIDWDESMEWVETYTGTDSSSVVVMDYTPPKVKPKGSRKKGHNPPTGRGR